MPQPRSPQLDTMACVFPNAAGLDIGAREIWAAIPPNHAGETVRHFGTFTADLKTLADWLTAQHIDRVAMESTGVYWIPVFELLEARGFHVALVNASALKHVPGRKTDCLDCQWIQKLHSLGLLSGSFRPDAEMCTLRGYLRHRAELLQHRAPHILHIQHALQHMNIQLHHVMADITGVTGLAILRAIVAGERNPLKLAQLRNPACKSSEDEIAKALTGTWKPEHLFRIKQLLELYDFYTAQVAACDAEIERQFAAVRPRWHSAMPNAAPDLPAKRGSHTHNQPPAATRRELFRIVGVDLVAVPGISASLALTILTETGTDMRAWPNEKHFTSWLGLAPHNDISGGQILRSRTLKTNNRAGQAFRQAAACVARSQSAFGAFYRRKRGQLGPHQALVATAHKIARTVYHMLQEHIPYEELGATAYEQRQRDRDISYLKKKAARLGFLLAEPTLASQPVSALI